MTSFSDMPMPAAAKRLMSMRSSGRLSGRLMLTLLAALALALQLLAPGMVRAQDGEWIEICSDFGAEMIQVDWSTGEPVDPQDCPDCADCTLCAAGASAATHDSAGLTLTPSRADAPMVLDQITLAWDRRYHWPSTRGPPRAPQYHHTDRVSDASLATPFKNGGALWT